MNSHATINELASRPKIHRLPSLPAHPPLPPLENPRVMRALWVVSAVLAVALVGVLYRHYSALPLQAQQEVQQTAALETPDFSGSSIYIKGSEGTIVGQMAKIPPESEKAASMKNISDVDKPAGRDLLAIISKY